jgi:hypothetical protein
VETTTRKAVARESHRVSLICKYHGVTNHRGSRITVQRNESNAYGKDPNKITVSWDYAIGTSENYQQAVQTYLDRAGWAGVWVTATTGNGAVAICAGDLS